jgi:Spy/CpxP family protein refolding chaperone
MGTKTKIAGLMVTLVALMALSIPIVYADNGGDKDSWHQDGGWHHGPMGHMMAKVLGLSDDQVKQIKDSREKQKTAMKALFEQMKTQREAFDAEIVKAAPDMNKINDIQTQIKTLQSQIVDSHLNSILEIKKIMTPEQFAGFMALKKEKELMMHMMGHGQFGHKDGWGRGKEDQGDND